MILNNHSGIVKELVENINFHCDYSLSDTLLTISEITTSSPFEVNTPLF